MSKVVHLCRAWSKHVDVIEEHDSVGLVIDLAESRLNGPPKKVARPYRLHLSADQARKLAIELMQQAQTAADFERKKLSP